MDVFFVEKCPNLSVFTFLIIFLTEFALFFPLGPYDGSKSQWNRQRPGIGEDSRPIVADSGLFRSFRRGNQGFCSALIGVLTVKSCCTLTKEEDNTFHTITFTIFTIFETELLPIFLEKLTPFYFIKRERERETKYREWKRFGCTQRKKGTPKIVKMFSGRILLLFSSPKIRNRFFFLLLFSLHPPPPPLFLSHTSLSIFFYLLSLCRQATLSACLFCTFCYYLFYFYFRHRLPLPQNIIIFFRSSLRLSFFSCIDFTEKIRYDVTFGLALLSLFIFDHF